MTSRALVLGGGGPVGIGWEAGMIKGLDDQGIHLADADLIVGTSAGSAVGTQIASGVTPAALFDEQLALVESEAKMQLTPDLQALIAIGHGVEIQPEWVWEVILEFGDSDDEDMQAAIGCVLLEHLLEYDYETYFPKLKEATLNGSPYWFKTAMHCTWNIPEDHKVEYQAFLDSAEG